MQRYDVPFGHLSGISTIQLRVAITLKYWIENHFTDFDHELGEKLISFVNYQLEADHYQIAKLLDKIIQDKVTFPSSLLPSPSSSPSSLFSFTYHLRFIHKF